MSLTPDKIFLIDFKLYQVPTTLGLDIPSADAASIIGVSKEDFDAYVSSVAAEVENAAHALLAEPDIARAIGRWQLQPKATIMTVGDSITALRRSYAELLSAMLKLARPEVSANMVNVGQSGFTSTNGLQDTYTQYLAKNPNWVFILFGANDVTRFGGAQTRPLVSMSEYRDNIALIASSFRQFTQARIILLTPTPVVESLANAAYGAMRILYENRDLAQYADCVRAVAQDMQLTCVELHDVFGMPPDSRWYGPDGLHPNGQGQ